MAHFAELDSNDVVLRVIVVNNDVMTNPQTGQEDESVGIAFCRSLFGATTSWVQTSYNGRRRKQYAGIGYQYERQRDRFICPKPFPSWNLDPAGDWQAPVPMPNDGKRYSWDEAAGAWVEVSTNRP